MKEGKRHPLSLRITTSMRERLQAEARESGRSVSQEVEMRLERTFIREEPPSADVVVKLLLAVLSVADAP